MKIKALSVSGYEAIKETFGLSDLAAKVCAAKSFNQAQIKELLSNREMIDPFCAQGINEVIQRITQARDAKEKVLICGDYDADGICATAILYDALSRYGITCGFYIPNRFKEGYGLHCSTVDLAKQKGYSLLITVDNGVKAFEALNHCVKLGIDTIVSDHHTMDQPVPCTHLLHSHTMGEQFDNLCGAGIALMISRALLGEIKEHVVLAAVASIGDVMPVWKETRKIIKQGIDYLKAGICQPIQALSSDNKWDERTIAFQIVPKLNATGRLADLANANNTVKFLLMKRKSDILLFAQQIDALNQKRRLMSAKMTEFAHTLVNYNDAFLMLQHEDFHEGLLGIIAAKLCEEYHKPAMVFSQAGEEMKGSIRSNHMIDLRSFFSDCPISLIAYGGHAAAAGISLHQKDYPAFYQYVQKKMETVSATDEIIQEAIPCLIEECDLSAVNELEALAPFGEQFSKPLFLIENYSVKEMKSLTNGKHVKWESLENIDALYFNAKDVYAKYQNETRLSFLGSLSVNEFRKIKKVNIIVDEIASPNTKIDIEA